MKEREIGKEIWCKPLGWEDFGVSRCVRDPKDRSRGGVQEGHNRFDFGDFSSSRIDSEWRYDEK